MNPDEPKKKPTKFQRISFDLPKQEAPQEAKPAVGKSLGGFAENLIDDAFQTVKGIGEGIIMSFYRSGKAAKDIWNDRDYWGKLAENPQLLTTELKKTGNAVVDAITEPYREHGADVVYHRPVGTLLDLATIVSLGGGSVAKMGKMAGNTKLEKLGRAIAESPGKVANKLLIDPAFKAVGIDRAKRAKALEISAHEKAKAAIKAENDKIAFIDKVEALDDAEAALWHKYRSQGGGAAELAASPKVKEALEAYRNWKEGEVQKVLKERGLIDDARIRGALEKKLAHEMGWGVGDEARAKAGKIIDDLEVKPVHGQSIHERLKDDRGYVEAFIDDFLGTPDIDKGGKVGPLERYSGAAGAITDPRKYVRMEVKRFRELEARLNTFERYMQQPGWIKAAGPGESMFGNRAPDPIFKKYYEDKARVQSAILNELKDKYGFDKAADMIRGDAETLQRMKSASTLVADKTIRRILQGEFYRQGGGLGAMLKVYDRLLSMFKTSATVLNPKWYTGNVIGDALLMQLAGVTFGDAARAKRFASIMPTVARSKGMLKDATTGVLEDVAPAIAKKLETAAEWTAQVDNFARAGIISKTVRNKLIATGTNFFELEGALKGVLQSPLRLSEMEVQIQLLMEEAVRKVPMVGKIDKEIAAKVRKFDKAQEYLKGKQPVIDPVYGQVTKGAKSKVSQAKVTATNEGLEKLGAEIEALQAQKQAIIADYADDMIQAGRLDKAIPGIREQAAIAQEGINRANAFLGDYLGLGPIEQGIFRRVVPFYVWGKAMTMLAFRLPFIAPGATFAWHKYAAAMATMHNDDDLPDWMSGYIPVFAKQDGGQVWAKMTSMSPFGGLRRSSMADVPIPAVADFVSQNPFISLVYKFKGGKDEWDSGSIPYGEPMVKMTTGDVYEFKDDGTLEKTIPQVPLIKGIVNMWPVVQMVDQLISPYDVRKGPELNSDGTYRYPREWWESLASMAGPRLMQGKREDFVRSEKRRIQKSIEGLRYAYKHASPERQEFIRNALREYTEGRFRKIAQK